jgi:hypothetical protein
VNKAGGGRVFTLPNLRYFLGWKCLQNQVYFVRCIGRSLLMRGGKQKGACFDLKLFRVRRQKQEVFFIPARATVGGRGAVDGNNG